VWPTPFARSPSYTGTGASSWRTTRRRPLPGSLDAADGDQDTPGAAGSTLEALDDVDTHVVSAALAAWCGTERSFDPTQHLKADPHTRRPDEERGR
jgi:hypothetical protein